jgi:hypothetical protein
LIALIDDATHPPAERWATRPSRLNRAQGLAGKKRRGSLKTAHHPRRDE